MLLPIDSNHKIVLEEVYNNPELLINFIYDHQRWFFVFKARKRAFFEIISYELAQDFGISSADCYLANTKKHSGIISKSVYNEDEQFFLLESFFLSHGINCVHLRNFYSNIKWIVDFFIMHYPKDASIIHEQLLHIFMFDTLIGNPDRNVSNIGLIYKNNSYSISTLFDNAEIGDLDYTTGLCALKVIDNEKGKNELEIFLKTYPDYLDIFKSKLWIIEKENLDKIFARIKETKNIKIPEDIQLYVKDALAKNLEVIKEVISQFDYAVDTDKVIKM